jgi:hypothetical protein
MLALDKWDSGKNARGGLLLVLFFLFVFFLFLREVAIFRGFFFLIFLIVVFVVGDEVEVHGMRLRNLELGFAFWAAQDFAFFDFVFVHIDFGGTLRAADHGSILRRIVRSAAPTDGAAATMAYYIPRRAKSTLMSGAAASIVNRSRQKS